MDRVRPLLGCLLLAIAPAALAARLELPLRVPMELVRDALAKQLSAQTGKGEARTGELWREGECRFLRLEPPTLDAAERGLLLSAQGTAMVGAEVLGKCAKAADWDGTVRFILEPRIDSAGILRLRVLDAAMKDRRGDKSAALAWDVIKPQ